MEAALLAEEKLSPTGVPLQTLLTQQRCVGGRGMREAGSRLGGAVSLAVRGKAPGRLPSPAA